MIIDDGQNVVFTPTRLNPEDFEQVIDDLKNSKAELITLSASRQSEKVLLLRYFFKDVDGKTSVLELELPNGKTVPSLYTKFQKADFIEREIHRFFGVKFLGHPNLGKEIA
jgi:NADH:ubiquinone oxidoreductase subunit C